MSYAKEKVKLWDKMKHTLQSETRNFLGQGFNQADAATLAFNALCVTYADWFYRKQEEVDALTRKLENERRMYEERIANQRKMIEQLEAMIG